MIALRESRVNTFSSVRWCVADLPAHQARITQAMYAAGDTRSPGPGCGAVGCRPRMRHVLERRADLVEEVAQLQHPLVHGVGHHVSGHDEFVPVILHMDAPGASEVEHPLLTPFLGAP